MNSQAVDWEKLFKNPKNRKIIELTVDTIETMILFSGEPDKDFDQHKNKVVNAANELVSANGLESFFLSILKKITTIYEGKANFSAKEISPLCFKKEGNLLYFYVPKFSNDQKTIVGTIGKAIDIARTPQIIATYKEQVVYAKEIKKQVFRDATTIKVIDPN